MKTVNILTIPIYSGNINNAVNSIVEDLKGQPELNNRCISATGAHGLIEANQSPRFKEVLRSFFWNLPDGMPNVWVGRLKGMKEMERCYGPDFFKATMMATASSSGVKHFLCGGKDGVADALKNVCAEKFKNQNIVGCFCPPFREMTLIEMEELGNEIIKSGAEIVWIGLSTPKQELFAARLSEFTKTGYIITVGAAFDFHTGLLKQAPKWMQMAGLEWFFRLIMEPKRLFKRYFKIVPLFIWLNIKEFAQFYAFKKKRI